MRGYAVVHPPGQVVLPVEAGWDQLVYAATGVMTVSTADGSWVIPAHRALWVPDGAPATIRTRSRVAVRTLYLATTLRSEGLPARARALNVTPLVRELLLHAVRACPLDLDDPVSAALVVLLLDRLRTLPDAPLQLPLPRDPRALAVARAVTADPAAPLTDLAAAAGAGRRTLDRSFGAATGMTLAAWQRRARMLRALELLGAGTPVTATGAAVGYSTPSSFVAAFKAELGDTPRRFLPGRPSSGMLPG